MSIDVLGGTCLIGSRLVGSTLAEARERAYARVDGISLAGSHHRTDIALAAERGEVAVRS